LYLRDYLHDCRLYSLIRPVFAQQGNRLRQFLPLQRSVAVLERTRMPMDLHATIALVTDYEDLIPGRHLLDTATGTSWLLLFGAGPTSTAPGCVRVASSRRCTRGRGCGGPHGYRKSKSCCDSMPNVAMLFVAMKQVHLYL
jgi:hypothetical protein